MSKSVLTGIVLENIESLKHYQTLKGENRDALNNVVQFVSDVIAGLPWYFRFPLTILEIIIAALCILATGHTLDMLSSEKRSSILLSAERIPFYGMLNKLVRSLTFLRLFDVLPFEPDFGEGSNFKSAGSANAAYDSEQPGLS